jgi:hypothetical protein
MKSFNQYIIESPEDYEPASPDEKSMAMRQAKFIMYVGEEIMEHLEKDGDFPEWMQNKLSALHQKAKDMHSTMAGSYEDEEDDDMNEATQVDEVLDTPKAMDSYKNKAKYGLDRAKSSAVASTLRKDKPSFDKAVKTMSKREKGLKMADKNATRKTFNKLRKEDNQIDEKLKASDDMGDWVKDFQKSDAPQFKGKSQKERQKMAIAAKLAAERSK